MNRSNPPQRNTSLRALLIGSLALVIAACASTTPAPVTDRGTGSTASHDSKPRAGYHVVQKGESIYGISRRYGVSVADIVSWNGLSNPNQIEVGQELRVASQSGAAVAASPGVVVKPIASSQVEVKPVTSAPAESGANGAKVYRTPKGGKQAYSDDALAAAQKEGDAPASTTPPTVTPPPAAAQNEDGGNEPAATGDWLWPTDGKVIAGFGGSSKGLDLSGDLGAPVVASSSGKVVYAGSGLRGYGKLVIIKHDTDFLTAYAHNRELLVKEGDSVSRGQKIAELGNTDADRPKLHFEIRRHGKPVDPLKYLPKR